MSIIYNCLDAGLRKNQRRVVFESVDDTIRATVERAVSEGVQLFNADLRGADLSGADLTGGVFQSCNMQGVNLAMANLSYADFSMSDLAGANIRNAIKYRAVLNMIARSDNMLVDAKTMLISAGFSVPVFVADDVINYGSFASMDPSEFMDVSDELAQILGGDVFLEEMPRIKALIQFLGIV